MIRLKSADYAAVPEPTAEEIQKYFQRPERPVQAAGAPQGAVREDRVERRPAEAARQRADGCFEAARRPGRAVSGQAPGPERQGRFRRRRRGRSVGGARDARIRARPDQRLSGSRHPGFAQAAFKLTTGQPRQRRAARNPGCVLRPAPERRHARASAHPRRGASEDRGRHQGRARQRGADREGRGGRAPRSRTAFKAGRPFDEAAKEAGQPVQNLPPFALAEIGRNSPDLEEIARGVDRSRRRRTEQVHAGQGRRLLRLRARAHAGRRRQVRVGQEAVSRPRCSSATRYFHEWLRASRDNARPQFNLRSQG